jgi:K+-sensing histidine kinase KdpD
LPDRLRGLLLRESLQGPETSALVCLAPFAPVSRLLVLHQHAEPPDGFLAAAADVCRRVGVRPVVLTVGRTDGEARRRQAVAEAVLAAGGLPADFDAVVGRDVRSAVAWAARWRRCSHVVVAKRQAAGWWRWPRNAAFQNLLGLSDRLTFLALPDRPAADGARIEKPFAVR